MPGSCVLRQRNEVYERRNSISAKFSSWGKHLLNYVKKSNNSIVSSLRTYDFLLVMWYAWNKIKMIMFKFIRIEIMARKEIMVLIFNLFSFEEVKLLSVVKLVMLLYFFSFQNIIFRKYEELLNHLRASISTLMQVGWMLVTFILYY